jgi:intein-encoded DNA endonuclease-like protein
MNKIDLNEQEVIKVYNERRSLRKTAKLFKVSIQPISRILKKYNIQLNSSVKYYVNENYFENIDTDEKAYWLGYIYADGYVRQRKGNSEFKFKLKDQDMLELFKKSIESNAPITKEKGTNCFNFIISRHKFVQHLISKGCLNKKSLILEFPTTEQLDSKYYSHFIRGYFDGDGCISFNNDKFYRQINILGTLNFVTFIKEILYMSNNYSHIGITKNHNIYVLSIQNIQGILTFKNFIYKNAKVYLERKFNKLKEFEDEIRIVDSKRKTFKYNY